MDQEARKSLLSRLQRHNGQIAQAAARHFLAISESARDTFTTRAGFSGRSSSQSDPPSGPERLVEFAADGFGRLGPTVGLSVLTDEPQLIADDLVWLRRMFQARGMVPISPEWEAQLLAAYVQAACDVLQDDGCQEVRDIVDRAVTTLSPA